MSTIVLSYPNDPGVCAEQACTDAIGENVLDDHWQQLFGLCLRHAEQFKGIQRRQREASRCPHSKSSC